MQFSWKKSFLLIYKILGLFFNPLTVNDKYSLLNRDNLKQHLQMQLSQKKQGFLSFSLHFRNLDSILSIFKKTMNIIGDVFFNLRTPKNVVR